MTRTAAPGGLNIQLTNTGGGPDIAADLVFPEGTIVLNVGSVSGAAGSCTPNSSQPRIINCFFDPPNGWSGGSTIMFDAQTNPPLPDNAGAQLFTCAIPCDPNMKSGPNPVTGPPPTPMVQAELEVKLEFQKISIISLKSGVTAYDLVVRRNASWTAAALATMTNHGPDTSAMPSLTVSSDRAPDATRILLGSRRFPSYTNQECERGTAFGPVRPLLCTHDSLEPSHTVRVGLDIVFKNLGAFAVHATGQSPTADPGQLPNTASISDEIVGAPLSDVGRARASSLNGVARFAREVFVGVAREEGGAKLGEPSAGGSRNVHARASAAGCRWLANKRVRFRRERGRRCDEPVYLRARVRRGRWAIRLKEKLPPGRYVMITRAVSSDGLIETAVGSRLGNLKRFRVKKR